MSIRASGEMKADPQAPSRGIWVVGGVVALAWILWLVNGLYQHLTG